MKTRGKIFLSGGGSEKESYLFDQEFIQLLKTRKILYIPLAMERDALGYEACYDWITTALTQFDKKFVDIAMWLDLSNKSLADLKQFEAIYFGGGNTYRLLEKIRISGFDELIGDFIKQGGFYYGGSAGAIIMGKSIETVNEENDHQYRYSQGLSLIGDYSFIAHYNKKTKEKVIQIKKFLSKYKTPVIALSEGVGLIVDSQSVCVAGKGSAVIFKLDGSKQSLLAGQLIKY